jgi:hypothetical protein
MNTVNISGYTPNQILARERKVAESMGTGNKVTLPIKSSDSAYEQLKAMGVVFGERRDHVLIKATLPAGWKIVPNGSDPRHRTLQDDKGKEVASIFLKNSGYDYYGSVYVNQDDK